MDSTADEDLAGELLDLTRQLRGQLSRHAAFGAWAAPGQQSARPALDDVNPGDAIPEVFDEERAAAIPGRRTLAQLREEIGDCRRCKLGETRRKLVFGIGAEDAPLMFVGEAPGEQEDKRGEPFVGPAGELLDKMIEAMGWTRQSVYITNVLMSRPPNNRNPQADEVAACLPFLDAKIDLVAPRIIVALGRPSANTLLGTDAPISTLRGKFHDRRGIKVMPTFHPAYLLREPDRKRDAWADLKIVMGELARLGIAAPHKA